MPVYEIEDENGNTHGPFETQELALKAAEDRGLGEQRHPDHDDGPGWRLVITQSAP